jgi:type IX secretion system PorP/SprF family membrane protein
MINIANTGLLIVLPSIGDRVVFVGKRMKRLFVQYCWLMVFVLCPIGLSAQDAYFSQSYASPLYLSPSFAGLTNGSRVAMSYRNQWPGVGNAYKTYALSYDQYLEKYRSGIGFLMFRDDRGGGMLVSQDAGFLYSYEIPITREVFVRPGIQFKYSERKIDPQKLIFFDNIGSQGEILPGQITSFDQEAYRKFDATASAMVYSDNFWFGFSFDHLVRNNVSFSDLESKLPIRGTFYGGYKIVYKKGYRSFDEQSVTLVSSYMTQDSFNQMDAGVYWYINPLEVGLLYRGLPVENASGLSNSDALVMIFGINIGSVRFSYSYDLTMSDLAGYSNGANELSLIYRFNQTNKQSLKRGPIPCGEPGVNRTIPSKYRSAPRKIF